VEINSHLFLVSSFIHACLQYSVAIVNSLLTIISMNVCMLFTKVTIWENVPLGTIIATVQAVDKDVGLSGEVVYHFASHTQSVHGQLFGIRNTTGVIYVTVR